MKVSRYSFRICLEDEEGNQTVKITSGIIAGTGKMSHEDMVRTMYARYADKKIVWIDDFDPQADREDEMLDAWEKHVAILEKRAA